MKQVISFQMYFEVNTYILHTYTQKKCQFEKRYLQRDWKLLIQMKEMLKIKVNSCIYKNIYFEGQHTKCEIKKTYYIQRVRNIAQNILSKLVHMKFSKHSITKSHLSGKNYFLSCSHSLKIHPKIHNYAKETGVKETI